MEILALLLFGVWLGYSLAKSSEGDAVDEVVSDDVSLRCKMGSTEDFTTSVSIPSPLVFRTCNNEYVTVSVPIGCKPRKVLMEYPDGVQTVTASLGSVKEIK